MDVVCLTRTVSIPDDLVSVWKDNFSAFWVEMMSRNGGVNGVWYGIVVLEV
jgi:hypothetical protein